MVTTVWEHRLGQGTVSMPWECSSFELLFKFIQLMAPVLGAEHFYSSAGGFFIEARHIEINDLFIWSAVDGMLT